MESMIYFHALRASTIVFMFSMISMDTTILPVTNMN